MIAQALVTLTPGEFAAGAVALAALMELLTVFLRFGLKLESRKHTSWIARYTRGLRVHHCYLGPAVALTGAATFGAPAVGNALALLGAALILSDLTHHFLVLWPVTGNPEFHLRYDED